MGFLTACVMLSDPVFSFRSRLRISCWNSQNYRNVMYSSRWLLLICLLLNDYKKWNLLHVINLFFKNVDCKGNTSLVFYPLNYLNWAFTACLQVFKPLSPTKMIINYPVTQTHEKQQQL